MFQSMSQDPALPGRYALNTTQQQPLQFPVGANLCFWVFRATGDVTPSKTVTWMESVTIDQLPFNYSICMTGIAVSEPVEATNAA